MLDHYDDGLVGCSLKTLWLCCRSRLLARRDYRDEIARNVLFCSGNNPLSALCPSSANDEDYRDAMQAVIPEGSIAVVKYWQQLNIIMRAAEESGFIATNPIPALLPEISNRASKELRNLRNMLTKKTLTFEEEARILAYVVGNKAPDTFSQHYCDYTNDLVQYGMVQKLNRWSHAHETGVQNTVQSTSEASTFTRNTSVHSDSKKNHYNAVSITVSPTKEVIGSYIDVLIECDHGVTGSIAVYDTAGKEDVQ